MTDNPVNLKTLLNFTNEDLKDNRQGKLSAEQADRIKSIRQRNVIIGAVVFSVLVIVATVFIFLGQQNQNTILSFVGGILTVVNAVLMGMMGRSYMRTSADLRDGGVQILEGKLERIVKRGRRGDNYMIRIDEASLYVTQEIFLQLQHKKPYRVYRTRLSGMLLSAERV